MKKREKNIFTPKHLSYLCGFLSIFGAIYYGKDEYLRVKSSLVALYSSHMSIFQMADILFAAVIGYMITFIALYIVLGIIFLVLGTFEILSRFTVNTTKKTSKKLKQRKEKKLSLEKDKEFQLIHDKYLNNYKKEKDIYLENMKKLGIILQDKLLNYDNNGLVENLDKHEGRNVKAIQMSITDKIEYTTTKKHVEFYTNEEKAVHFKKQLDLLSDKFGQLDTDHYKKYYVDLLNTNRCSDLFKFLNHSDFDEDDKSSLKDFSNHLRVRAKIADDMIFKYLKSRVSYLFDAYKNASTGVYGEQQVSNELNKYKDEFINIESKTFNLKYIDFIDGNYKMECDNILITRHGVFVLETKNKGNNSVIIDKSTGKQLVKYYLHIENEGRWVQRYENGKVEVWERNPVVQNRDHIIKLRKIINTHLGLDIDDDNYVDVKGIIVIANDTLEIKNDPQIKNICRVNKIYESITEHPRNKYLTTAKMKEIEDIINLYNTPEHSPDRFGAINVYNELNELENQIKEYCNFENSDFINEVYEVTSDFANIRNNIFNELDEVKEELYS